MVDYDIMERIRLATRNPAAYVQVGLDYIEARLNNTVIPDPLSPMVQQIEISSAQSVVHIEEAMAIDRRSYPVLSTKMRDLYGHASDYDMITRFSQPATTTINILLPREELIARMVQVPGSQLRKIVIPRNTTVWIDNQTPLITLYPIEIRQPIHKGVTNTKAPLLIVYNTDKMSPLQTLDDNVVDWNSVTDGNGRKYVNLSIEVLQLKRTTLIDTIEGGKFIFHVPYEDKFHAVRVFWGSNQAGWNELKTTFSEWVYSNRTPTGIIHVEENTVQVRIPPVYMQNNQIPEGTPLRVDIYTTKGPMEFDLAPLQASAFTVDWAKDIDDSSLEQYAAPIRNLEFAAYSPNMITGGANGLTFLEMQNAIINNINIIDIPITPSQIVGRLETLGFDVIKHRDDITDRVYLASKTLSQGQGSNFSAAPSSGIMTLQTTIDSLAKHPGVWDNNARVTISPKTLFRLNDGILSLVEPGRYPGDIAFSPENIANQVNSAEYVFSPFHYVLDTNNNNFRVRPYHLEQPRQVTREFLHENESTQLEVQTTGFKIERGPLGYILTVMTLVGPNWRALRPDQRFAQLGFVPYGERDYAYLNGKFKGEIQQNNAFYHIYEFPIEGNFDLDENDNLIVNNFAIFTALARDLPLPLTTDFTLTYSVNDYVVDGLENSEVDGYLGKALLPLDVIGVTAEKVGLVLGTALKSFWATGRSLGGSIEYKKYETDIMAVWEKDEYEVDPVSGARKFKIVNGKVEYTKLHSKGDPVLVDGKQAILYPKGSLVYDEGTGLPIPVSDRPVLRLVDMFMVDGVYYYANDAISKLDMANLTDNIVRDYIPRLETLINRKLEKTDIFLYPKKTMGNIPVLIDDAVEINIFAQLNFQFTFMATETGYRDTEFREMIESIATAAVSQVLRNPTVSKSAITSILNANADERLAGFEIRMYAGNREMIVFTVKDDSYRASVRRLAKVTDEAKIAVKEDISFEWDLHLPDQ